MAHRHAPLVHLCLLLLFICTSTSADDCVCTSQYFCNCNSKNLTGVPQSLNSFVTILGLGNNRINTLESNDLNRYTHLEHLYLYGNRMTMISTGAFRNLEKLYELELENNELVVLRAGAFQGLGSLHTLELNINKLQTIEAGVFNSLSSLVVLYLHYNELQVLTPEMFQGLGNLNQLHLYNNLITTVHPRTFSHMAKLQYLYLFYNKIHTFDLSSVSGLTNLRRISLYNNNLTSVPQGDTTPNLSGVTHFNMLTNNIAEISANSFSGFDSLQYLRLSYNKISTIHEDAFKTLHDLRELYLNGNSLRSLDGQIFSGLGSLRSLSLEQNEIEFISSDAFTGLTTLTYLKLEDNKLKIFPVEPMSGLRVYNLYLQRNLLTSLPDMAYRLLDRTSRVILHQNPWKCDCRMIDFRRLMRGRSFEYQIVCDSPDELRGTWLKDVPLPNLTCAIPLITWFEVTNSDPLKEGNTLNLFCEVWGSQNPEITLRLPNGKHVLSTLEQKGRVQVLPNGTITIDDITGKDSGTYVCIANGIGGDTEKSLYVPEIMPNPFAQDSLNGVHMSKLAGGILGAIAVAALVALVVGTVWYKRRRTQTDEQVLVDNAQVNETPEAAGETAIDVAGTTEDTITETRA
ncbi:LRRC15 [Branchiostoma lanceolatum]|uniref:LRRC15 protein n=1 Tax=Branchiostoma lanceolatum TaxID=7740 RepID=A0A8K0A3W6_BRALA|nr:LRRC15 [Branchiostoma lanceolatum]